MILHHGGQSDQTWERRTTLMWEAGTGLVNFLLHLSLVIASALSFLPPPPPKGNLNWSPCCLFWFCFYWSSFLCIQQDILPLCCPFCLPLCLILQLPLPGYLLHTTSYVFALLVVTSLTNLIKMPMHCVWMCHNGVSKCSLLLITLFWYACIWIQGNLIANISWRIHF